MSLDTIEQAEPRTEAARVETWRRQRLSPAYSLPSSVYSPDGVRHQGSARFALSDAFDELQLPTVTLPGRNGPGLCAAVPLGCCWLPVGPDAWSVAIAGRRSGRALVSSWASGLGGLWSGPAFPVSNQFAGTLSLATPWSSVRYAGCCVMLRSRQCVDRGQFLSAALRPRSSAA